MNESFLAEYLLFLIAAAVCSVWGLLIAWKKGVAHAMHRLLPLPALFYLFNRRHALLRPWADEPGAVAKKLTDDCVVITRETPSPMTMSMLMRTHRVGTAIYWQNKPLEDEHFLCEFEFQTPLTAPSGIRIQSTPPDAQAFSPPEVFDVLAMNAVDRLYLCVDHPTRGDHALGEDMDVLLDFLGGDRMSSVRSDVSSRMVLVPQKAAPNDNAKAHSRLWDVTRKGDTCTMVYAGMVRHHTSGLRARAGMTRVISRAHDLLEQLTRWEARTLPELAWECIEDEARTPAVRFFALRVLYELYDMRQSASSSELDRLEGLVHLRWRDYNLERVLPWMRESFFDGCTVEDLIERASVFEHPRLKSAIVERSSLSALLGSSSVLIHTRREALVSALHLRRSFLRVGEETLSNISAHDLLWVTDILLERGWLDLWVQPWMHALYHRHIAAMTAPENQSLCARVFLAAEDGQSEVAREALLICEAAYVSMIHGARDRGAVLERVPVRMLLHLLARRADLDADALEWAHLRAHISSAELRDLYAYSELRELQRLELLGQLLADPRVRDMILEEPAARHPLLKVFEVAGAASASMDALTYDRIAHDMLWYNEAVFPGRDELKVLEYAIKAYVRQVERQGARKSALETMRAISKHLPRKHERWVDPVIARWTEQMGAGRMAGALTHSDEDEHAGALSVTDEER